MYELGTITFRLERYILVIMTNDRFKIDSVLAWL